MEQVVVSNMLGQTVISVDVTSDKINMNTGELNKGIYTISILDKSGNSRTEKIIKN